MDEHKHWTEDEVTNHQLSLALDFVDQLELPLKERGWTQAEIAKRKNVTEGRVSQVSNNPGNMTLRSMIEWARPLGMKVAVVVYDDGDAENRLGLTSGQIFRSCWEQLGKPQTNFELDETAKITQGFYLMEPTCVPMRLIEDLVGAASDQLERYRHAAVWRIAQASAASWDVIFGAGDVEQEGRQPTIDSWQFPEEAEDVASMNIM